ncbi:MAG TPA: hypothetical protein DD490_33400 [Acidobacteria bacterium]|nr:hypothetical protein [Acidobacteriota bacterium]
MDHLTDGDVEGFLSGGLPREAFRRVVRHLMAPCAYMAEAVRTFLDEAQRDRGLRFDMTGVMRRGMEMRGEG